MGTRESLAAMASPRTSRTIATAIVLVLVAAGAVVALRSAGEETLHVTADFRDTTGLYVGNEVDHLGVPVGEVVRIEPRGTHMRVHMEIAPDTRVPADAGAEILQSSLVTDRYVELGPTFEGGPLLADGAHIGLSHTRSPATIDEITRSVDRLVRAMDTRTPGGKDIGDLLQVGARNLDGNGRRIRDALVDGEAALHSLNSHSEDIMAVTRNLATLTDALAARDTLVRRFSRDLAQTSAEVADQRRSLTRTFGALVELSEVVARFVKRNDSLVERDVRKARRLVRAVHRRRASLGAAWDVMPTLAQNMTQAYDQEHRALRVQFNTQSGPFSPQVRATLCARMPLLLCPVLFQPDGSGLLDPVLDGVGDGLPRNAP